MGYRCSTDTAQQCICNYADVTGAVFATDTIAGETVTTISYSVADGGALDDDDTENASIVDPIGPAVLAAPTTGDAGAVDDSETATLEDTGAKTIYAIVTGFGLATISIAVVSHRQRSSYKATK